MVSMFTLAPPRSWGPTTHTEVELFQQKLRAERKAEINALRSRPQTSDGSLMFRSTSTLAEEFPESPAVLASPAFRTLRGAGRVVSAPSASGNQSFQLRPVTAPWPRERVSPELSYTLRLSMGFGCCTPLERTGLGGAKRQR